MRSRQLRPLGSRQQSPVGCVRGAPPPRLHGQLWTQEPSQCLQVKSCRVGYRRVTKPNREENGENVMGELMMEGERGGGGGRGEQQIHAPVFTFIFSSLFSTCAASNCLCFSRSLSMEAVYVCCRFLIWSLMLLFSKVTSTRVFWWDENKNQI